MKDNRYGVQLDFSKWKIPSNQMVIVDSPSIRKDSPSIRKDSPSKQMDSRDLSKRAIQEKGLSTQEKKKKREADKRGLKMLKETLSKGPGGKLRWK